MKQILLSQGQFALVDDEDFERVSQVKWHAWWNKGTKSFYACRNVKINGKRTSEYMHRFILGLKTDNNKHIDRLNHNTLDNRKENMNIVTNRGNHHNMRNQSQYGPCIYYYRHKKNPFQVQVRVNGKSIYIGYFPTQEAAATARDEFNTTNGLSL